jgi:hypothetical protein
MDTCPKCGSIDVAAYDTCHTWPSGPNNTKWMSCQGCGSAVHIFCCEDDCDWDYDWGLNPLNPRAERNEEDRPAWLVGDFNERYPEGWVYPYNSGVARPLDSPIWDEYNENVREQIATLRLERDS